MPGVMLFKSLLLEEFEPPKEKFKMVMCVYCWNQMQYYPFNRCALGSGGTCKECARTDRKQVCRWNVSGPVAVRCGPECANILRR